MAKRSICEGLMIGEIRHILCKAGIITVLASIIFSDSTDATIISPSGKRLQGYSQRSALVIFAQFADEGISKKAPSWSKDLFDVNIPGSFSHFYKDMSDGRFSVVGAVLPKRYISFGDRGTYIAEESGEVGGYGRVNLVVLFKAAHGGGFGIVDYDGARGVAD